MNGTIVLLGRSFAGIAVCALAPAICLGELDADTLISRLARPPAARIAFAEARFSPLLREPIIISGELGYGGPGVLDRHVVTPYAETVAVRGQSVRVERDGDTRTFRLRRAPELHALLTGFVALLAGDPSAVRSSFDVRAMGDDGSWRLTLTPLDTNIQERLNEIVVTGSQDEPRCVATGLNTQDGATSVMLLGAAAPQKLAPGVTLADALALCHAE